MSNRILTSPFAFSAGCHADGGHDVGIAYVGYDSAGSVRRTEAFSHWDRIAVRSTSFHTPYDSPDSSVPLAAILLFFLLRRDALDGDFF